MRPSISGMKRITPMAFLIGLGILIMTIGVLTFLGIFSPKIGLIGAGLAIIMTLGTLSFLVTTPEVWVPDLGSGEHGFPLLTGAGRWLLKMWLFWQVHWWYSRIRPGQY